MNLTILDFETYYEQHFSLKKLSIPEYVHDPRFHVHGLAIRWPDGKAEFRVDVGTALVELQARFGRDLEGTTVAGHHLQFDFYILNHVYDIRPRHFIDTMLLAHHVHGRRDGAMGQSVSLGALAAHYGLQAKGDLDFMSGVRTPDVQQLAELAAYAMCDVQLTRQLAELLLSQITRPEVELPILMHTVRLFTERAIRVDVGGIDRIEQQVREASELLLAAANATPQAISKNGSFNLLLKTALARSGRLLPLKPGKRELIPATAKTDREMQALLDDDDPAVANLARARLEKKGEDQKLARLATLRRVAGATGGKLPAYLVYFGGHTGRFAGGGGFNIQNLGRTGLGGQVRGLLIPRPGHRFIIADFAQIEARITAWYADEQQMLQAFAENRDLYSEFASRVFGRPVRKPSEADPPDIHAQLGPLRQVGKQATLGLGFGMGALKFMNTLRADTKAARLFEAGDLTPLVCREIVETFRADYPGIKQFWSQLEDAAFAAIDGISTDLGRLRVARVDDVTQFWLPSGRALRYPELRLDPTQHTIRFLDENGQEAEFVPDGPAMVYGRCASLYGGKLCENVVQATARDLLVEAILRLENCGIPVLFHVHDEVVVEVPNEEVNSALEIVRRELSYSPTWASGLPVACEVWAADRYGK